MEKAAISPIISTAILLAITIAIGLFLWFASASWASGAAVQFTGEINKAILQQKSFLIIEIATVDPDSSSAAVWVSNPGQVPVIVTKCIIYPSGGNPPTANFQEIAYVDADMSNPVKLTSCAVSGQPPYVVKVWYIAAQLFDPNDPSKNIQWGSVAKYEIEE